MQLPEGKYGAVLVDPPWHFKVHSITDQTRLPDYDTMSLDDIKALPVADLAADNCALFLWVTDPLLPRGLDVMAAWGFTFKTVAFYWAKTKKNDDGFTMGSGYWTRANPEQCLLGVRGRPIRCARDVRRLVVAPRREHSRKPDRIHTDIQRLVPGPYCELFARQQRPGWTVWGNETERFAA